MDDEQESFGEEIEEIDFRTDQLINSANHKIADIERKIMELRTAVETWNFPESQKPELKRKGSERFSKEDIEKAVDAVIRREDEVFDLSQEEQTICKESSLSHQSSLVGWETNKWPRHTDTKKLIDAVGYLQFYM